MSMKALGAMILYILLTSSCDSFAQPLDFSATFAWDARPAEEQVDKYVVEWKVGTTAQTPIEVLGTVTSAEVTTQLAPGGTITGNVKACNAKGCSALSEFASIILGGDYVGHTLAADKAAMYVQAGIYQTRSWTAQSDWAWTRKTADTYGAYLCSTGANGFDEKVAANISLYIFAEAQGNYTLWIRGLSPGLPNDTVRVYAGDGTINSLVTFTGANTWQWQKVVPVLPIVSGKNTIKVYARHPGVCLDRILLSRDDTFIPVGIGQEYTPTLQVPGAPARVRVIRR